MSWTVVTVETDWTAAEAVGEILKAYAFQQSVVYEQFGDDRLADPLALLPAVHVKATVRPEDDTPPFRRSLESALAKLDPFYQLPPPRYTVLADRDWSEAWKEHYYPIRISPGLLIMPSWLGRSGAAPSSHDSQTVLYLDPGMAFGTGQHATTRACLTLLERLLQPGASVLDVGTGSGILAIGAALLGAGRVWALDNDEVAVAAARHNSGLNGVGDQVEVRFGSLPVASGHDWDLILVNILAPVIVTMLQEEGLLSFLASRGRVLLSGIVDSQRPAVEKVVFGAGGRVLDAAVDGEWVTLVVGSA